MLEVLGRRVAAIGRPVLNGDMDLAGVLPVPWDGLRTASGSLLATRDALMKHGGKASLRFANEAGDGNANQLLLGSAVPREDRPRSRSGAQREAGLR